MKWKKKEKKFKVILSYNGKFKASLGYMRLLQKNQLKEAHKTSLWPIFTQRHPHLFASFYIQTFFFLYFFQTGLSTEFWLSWNSLEVQAGLGLTEIQVYTCLPSSLLSPNFLKKLSMRLVQSLSCIQLRIAKNVAQHKIATLLNTLPAFSCFGNSSVEMSFVDDITSQCHSTG